MTTDEATYGDAEKRTREIVEKVQEADEPVSEEIVWKAIRAAYSKGYDDGLKIREEDVRS